MPVIFSPTTLYTSTSNFNDYADWLDPKVFEKNREPMHTTFNINPNYAHRIGLAGIWKFNFSEQAEGRPEDFYKTSYDDSGWGSIPVPGLYQPQLCMGRQLQE